MVKVNSGMSCQSSVSSVLTSHKVGHLSHEGNSVQEYRNVQVFATPGQSARLAKHSIITQTRIFHGHLLGQGLRVASSTGWWSV